MAGTAALCAACGGNAVPGTLEKAPEHVAEPPAPLFLSTDPVTVGPGVDQDRQCQVFTLNNEDELLLSAVELTSTRGMHHSDWFVFPENQDLGRGDGNGRCAEFAMDLEHDGTRPAAVAFSQSTQSLYEEQAFGERVALPIPPHSKFYVSYHMLNTTDEPLDVHVEANLHFTTPASIEARLVMGGGLMGLLAVPPRARSRFYSECRFAQPTTLTGYFVMPHYHQYGTGLTLELLGGARDGEKIWDSHGSIGDAMGARLSPPVSFEGAEGVRFGCSYDNTTDRTLIVGNDGNEMCNFFVHTDGANQWYAIASPAFGGSTLVDHGTTSDGVRTFEVTNCMVLVEPP